MNLPQFYVDDVIMRALREDINYLDVSSDYLLPDGQRDTAYFVSKADGVLCGLSVALRTFELLDASFEANVFKHDGDRLKKGDVIAEFSGETALLLKGERTALNLMQHMSGVATATARAVELVRGTNAQITDTRKTLPGLRALEKYAVVCGGGKNHRFNLSDGAMLKDNHIDAGGGIQKTVDALRGKLGHMVKIEVETRNLEEVRQALEARADIIMLDNMAYDDMRRAVELIAGRAKVEASGGITLENLREVALTGVDIISLGALTHSVHAFDISMRMKK
ncbi:MAG TPA: carboxylating nicotinate-nucleotide diphosphorylase [Candidatus Fimenecus excrementigallinarum]|uniref:Probable nicotinate-nucleotide pyrophosphorylase [carboxylating] n=1 Tax=Candidatus Fimenecus excrementigallinarum TaxID=2840816 RepID=A0A9D1LE40_9FIRM|nr:carboxylating nicotinate-nucleotide diphosphorylase [Candidatus Fimenecus excrementigallinarum]